MSKIKDITNRINEMLIANKLSFSEKPILIGGMAMEYYEMRKAGEDIDLIVSDDDYQTLAQKYHQEALLHEKSYSKMSGVVFGGKYDDQ